MTKYPPPLALGALFDADFYLSQCPNDPEALKDPLEHFTKTGWLLGLDPHPLFSVRYYLYQKQELLKTRVNPLLHYMAHPAADDIDPHPLFDTKYYKARTPNSEEIPLLHYLKVGYKTLSPHPLFDRDFYTQQVKKTNDTTLTDEAPPLVHYLVEGVKHNLSPHPLFCALFYCSQRPDVVGKAMNPLIHYVQFGSLENAKPHPLFDTSYFSRQSGVDLARYSNPLLAFLTLGADDSSPHKLFDIAYYRTQLKARGVSQLTEHPLVHYLREGHTQGLRPHPLFDSVFYSTNNPYISKYHMEPLTHYVAWGVQEGRNPHPFFDTDWYRLKYPELQRLGSTPLEAYLEDWEHNGNSDPCWALSTTYYLEQRPACRTANVTPPFHYYSYCKLPLVVEKESLPFPSTEFAEIYARLNSQVGVKRTVAPVRVIVTSHDASRTGAPLIALNIARELKTRYGVECIIILARGGPLEADFAEVGTVINFERLKTEHGIGNFAPHILAISKPARTIAIVNSLECADILRLLASMDVPCYSLIHEFTERYNEYNVRSVFDNSRFVAFPSELVKRDAVVHHSRLSSKPNDARVIPQGLNDAAFLRGSREKDRADVCTELDIPADTTIILGVGSIQCRKGCDLFVLAAQQFIRKNPDRPVAFVWIGDSDQSNVFYEDWVYSDIYRAGLTDKVFFVGPREDTRRYYYAADIFLHLARLDPFPCVILEAMAARLPVVLFDQTIGSAEVVRDDAGIVVPFLDMFGVNEALTTLVDDVARREQMGLRGRERIEQSFSFSHYVDTILKLVCADRNWRQIGSFRTPSLDTSSAQHTKLPVYFGASSWNISGTNVLWKHVIDGLRSLGWDARVLFTDRLVIGEHYHEPQIAHSCVAAALKSNTQERWCALQSFLMQAERCIFFAGDDTTSNSIIPALPSHVGVVGTLLGGRGADYEQGYRLGLYCNRIISLSEDLTASMCRYNPGLLDRIRTIPAHILADPTQPRYRAARQLGVPLQILLAGGSTSSEQYLTHCEALLNALDIAAFPYQLSLLISESARSVLEKLGPAYEEKMRRGAIRVLSHPHPEQLTKLLQEHDTLILSSDFGALAPTLTTSLSYGCIPVVIQPHMDLSKILSPGRNAVVLEGSDWNEVARALRDLYSNTQMATLLQQAALDIKHHSYTVSEMVAAYDQVLTEVAVEVSLNSWTRPQPFVWSTHFGDALPPQNVVYPHEAL